MSVSFQINTNIASINAQRNLGRSKMNLDKSLERLSSGYRINRAGDDAAGMGISESLRAEIRGLGQARRNSQDGISLIQIAEGALASIANILIRLRELAIQSSSDTVSPEAREFLNLEFEQQKEEIYRIIASSEFNGVKLLAGKGEPLEIQVGTGSDSLTDRLVIDPRLVGIDMDKLGVGSISLTDKAASQGALSIIDEGISVVSRSRSHLGALQNRFQSVISNLEIALENLQSANSQIRDTDWAKETAEMTKGNILVRAGTSVLAQANQTPSSVLSLISSSF